MMTKGTKKVLTGFTVLNFALFLFLILTMAPVFAGTITYTYDDAGRLTKVDYGDGKTIEYTYDNAGNLLQRVVTETPEFTLTVVKSGAGSGTVTSSPSGIDCGSDCSESYNQGTSVTLTATPASGSTFGGWSGACSGTGTCTVTMNAAKSVTATFNLQAAGYTLTVVKPGTGTGTVTSSPAGINCGDDCSETYSKVQKVKLTAKADASSTFTGWSGGGCSGTKTCTVTVNDAVTVTADFALKTPDISVAQTPIDFGTVKVGKKVTKTLKIMNNGTGDLVVALSVLDGTDFYIQGGSVIIKSKKSYTLKVLFTPHSTGSKTGTLRITTNDSDTPTIDISLSGTGQ
jgi:YD repeat-containing protein